MDMWFTKTSPGIGPARFDLISIAHNKSICPSYNPGRRRAAIPSALKLSFVPSNKPRLVSPLTVIIGHFIVEAFGESMGEQFYTIIA